MSTLQEISSAIDKVDSEVFAEMCSSFLALRNDSYKAYSRNGSHKTKQKPIRGNPDCFFLLPNGNYVFVEITTTENKAKRLLNKLKADIDGCLDETETHIPIDRIQEIVLCYNSRLSLEQIEEVNLHAEKVSGRLPQHYDIDRLSKEIFFHHKDLAFQYLKIPLDTGQIMSLDKFVERYNSRARSIATPLDNKFLHREEDLKKLKYELEKEDIVVITGTAGVGKTKLGLEGVRMFLDSGLAFNSYAISSNGCDLFQDLRSYFRHDERNILFVDDVNRVDKFLQILSFYDQQDRGSIKLVLTVRDYAFESVRSELIDFKFGFLKVSGFAREEIVSIIEAEPFCIRNGNFQHEIAQLAQGNPRLAIMASLVSLEEKHAKPLTDVSDLFDRYFGSFVKDNALFKEKKVLKTLGILSFFYTLRYDDEKILDAVSENFNIKKSDFLDSINRLEALDYVQVQYEYVKIGEQNLSTFLFFKVFVKDKLLSFENLIFKYYKTHPNRFSDTIYPTRKNFDDAVVDKSIRPSILKYWHSISDDNEAYPFLKMFWELLPDELLKFTSGKVEANPVSDLPISSFSCVYKTNDFVNKRDKTLQLLSFLYTSSEYVDEALRQSLEYIRRNPKRLPEFIYSIDETIVISDDDYENDFERQKLIVNFFLEGIVSSDPLLVKSFFALTKMFLKASSWKNHKLSEAEENANLLLRTLKEVRASILDAIDNLYPNYPEQAFNSLVEYSIPQLEVSSSTFQFDLNQIIPIIDKHFDNGSFRHCYYVQEMIRVLKRHDTFHSEFPRLQSHYENQVYADFQVLTWNRRRGMEDYDFDDNKEFDSLKRADIASRFRFSSLPEVQEFTQRYEQILSWEKIDIYSQDQSAEIIICSNLEASPEMGFQVFSELVAMSNRMSNSKLPLRFSTYERVFSYAGFSERFWIETERNKLDASWRFESLLMIPEYEIGDQHFKRLKTVIANFKHSFGLDYRWLVRYGKVNPKIYGELLSLVTEKNESDDLQISVYDAFLEEYSLKIDDISLLKKAYAQQATLHNHFDHGGKGLLALLKRDSNFLSEYLTSIFDKNKYESAIEHKELGIVWELTNGGSVVSDAISQLAQERRYYCMGEHIANAFFKGPGVDINKLDDFILEIVQTKADDYRVIDIIFNVVHFSRRNLFERAFELYITTNSDVESFRKITWTDRQMVYSGNIIIGDFKAKEWEKVLTMVKGCNGGRKLGAIKRYIQSRIEGEEFRAEGERRRKFLGHW